MQELGGDLQVERIVNALREADPNSYASSAMLNEISKKIGFLQQDFEIMHREMQDNQHYLEEISEITKATNASVAHLIDNDIEFPMIPLFLSYPASGAGGRITRLFKDKFKLFFICPITGKVAETNGGEGFKFSILKSWVVQAAPILILGLAILKGVLAVHGIPTPCLTMTGIKDMSRTAFGEYIEELCGDINDMAETAEFVQDELDQEDDEHGIGNDLHENSVYREDVPEEVSSRFGQAGIMEYSKLMKAKRALRVILEKEAEKRNVDISQLDYGLVKENKDGYHCWLSDEAKEEFMRDGKESIRFFQMGKLSELDGHSLSDPEVHLDAPRFSNSDPEGADDSSSQDPRRNFTRLVSREDFPGASDGDEEGREEVKSGSSRPTMQRLLSREDIANSRRNLTQSGEEIGDSPSSSSPSSGRFGFMKGRSIFTRKTRRMRS
jgi:hypothetical protein